MNRIRNQQTSSGNLPGPLWEKSTEEVWMFLTNNSNCPFRAEKLSGSNGQSEKSVVWHALVNRLGGVFGALLCHWHYQTIPFISFFDTREKIWSFFLQTRLMYGLLSTSATWTSSCRLVWIHLFACFIFLVLSGRGRYVVCVGLRCVYFTSVIWVCINIIAI